MIAQRSGGSAVGDWRLARMLSAGEYEARLDAVLEAVSLASGLPDCYLYLPDASGRRLRLVRSRATPPAARATNGGDGVATPTPADMSPLESQHEGGAGWSAPAPPLERACGPEDLEDRVIETPVGRLYAAPLLDHERALRGVVQIGPVRGRAASRRLAGRLDQVREPLAFVIDQARAAESTRQQLAEANARLEAGQRLAASALDLDRFTNLLLELGMASTRSDAGFVAVPDATGALAVSVGRGMPEGFERALDLSPTEGAFDWSPAEDGGALVLADFDAAARLGIRSLLAVPLLDGGDPLGVFALVNFGEGGTFDETSLELCATFAEQIRLMLQNSRVFNEFSSSYLETVKGLARALDARSPETREHHARVAEVAAALAEAIALDQRQVDAVRTAGLIHDVGLAAVADAGDATADIEHPTVGAALVEHLPLHPEVTAAVAGHHEWYDGWGFPLGLADERIAIGGRILAIAEFIVEMTTDTRVRPAWPRTRLVDEIAQRRGTQFDPGLADAAIELLQAGDGFKVAPTTAD